MAYPFWQRQVQHSLHHQQHSSQKHRLPRCNWEGHHFFVAIQGPTFRSQAIKGLFIHERLAALRSTLGESKDAV